METEDLRAWHLEWTNGTITIDQVRDKLETLFDLKLKRESVRSLLADIGAVAPAKMGSLQTGRGRISFYDPLVCWLAYVAFKASQRIADANMVAAEPVAEMKSSRDVRMNVLANVLDDYRDEARKAVWGRLAATPKKRNEYTQLEWDWRVESTAYHLFISDPVYGMDPRELHELLERRPHLLYLTLDSNCTLESVLRVYVANCFASTTGTKIDPNEVNLFGQAREPIYSGRINASDTLGVLDHFGWLRAGGRRLSEPEHVYFDQPDILDPEWGGEN